MKPTITVKKAFLHDCDKTTNWTLVNVGLVNPTATVESGDLFKLEGTCDDAGSEYARYIYDLTATGETFSSSTYPKFVLRYKTSASSNGLGALVEVKFSDASNQILLNTSLATEWTTVSGTLTAGKTVNEIRLYMDDEPNSVDSGTYQVYYDFVWFGQYIFEFPYVSRDGESGGIELTVQNRYANLQIPGRVGNISQFMGMDNPVIKLSGDMDTNTNWVTSPVGSRLYMMCHRARLDEWCWFESDLIKCKVTPRRFWISQKSGSKVQRVWNLELQLHSLSPGDLSTWQLMDWFGW